MSEAVAVACRVRPVAAADLAGVTALLAGAGLPADAVSDQFEDGFVVAEAESGLVGAAGLEIYGAYGLLRSVVVDPEWRGRGVGEALVQERLAYATTRGIRRVYLLTTTAPAWFEKLGFTHITRDDVPASVRRSPEFAGVCPSSADVMELRLVKIPSACCGPASRPASLRGAEFTNAIDAADPDTLKAVVREKYGAAADRAATGQASSCCGASADELWDPITADLYEAGETEGLPAEALLASLGCGNPTALAQLNEGETVLDLGSGGGIDVLLSARRVGDTGYVYGLDMTDEMLALARANQARAGATNVEFLKGDIESIPLPDASVDVIISNCVINLAADKSKVLREAFRVLKPGGRFAVSDVVARRDVPAEIRRSAELWMGCVAGALHEAEYARLMEEAGFVDVALEPTRVYSADDMRHFLEGASLPVPAALDEYDGAFMSAFVRGRRAG
ncbi:MAG TPA: arsenic resistance N-acetyltransferase ArsN2 [Longimicrobiales bacterium]|nr:arsenic resistance N-acetyltransferase ArsN2 [Longimicrobiales bacterium]